MMEQLILALKAHAKGHIEKHKSNVILLLQKPSGIAEHPDIVETIDYTVIQSSGNALDFGNMTSKQCYYAAISDTHGGLGGF